MQVNVDDWFNYVKYDGLKNKSQVIVFKQLYLGIVVSLDYLIENGDSETSSHSTGYEKALTNTNFAVSLIIVNRVFCIIKPYAEQLQQPTCDLLRCYQSIEQASIYLTELIHDDNQLDELYNELINFIEINEINNCLSRVTTRRYQTLQDFFYRCEHYMSSSANICINIRCQFLDLQNIYQYEC